MMPGFPLEEGTAEDLILNIIFDFPNLRIYIFPLFPEQWVFFFFLIISSNEITALILQILDQNLNLLPLGLLLFDPIEVSQNLSKIKF